MDGEAALSDVRHTFEGMVVTAPANQNVSAHVSRDASCHRLVTLAL